MQETIVPSIHLSGIVRFHLILSESDASPSVELSRQLISE